MSTSDDTDLVKQEKFKKQVVYVLLVLAVIYCVWYWHKYIYAPNPGTDPVVPTPVVPPTPVHTNAATSHWSKIDHAISNIHGESSSTGEAPVHEHPDDEYNQSLVAKLGSQIHEQHKEWANDIVPSNKLINGARGEFETFMQRDAIPRANFSYQKIVPQSGYTMSQVSHND